MMTVETPVSALLRTYFNKREALLSLFKPMTPNKTPAFYVMNWNKNGSFRTLI